MEINFSRDVTFCVCWHFQVKVENPGRSVDFSGLQLRKMWGVLKHMAHDETDCGNRQCLHKSAMEQRALMCLVQVRCSIACIRIQSPSAKLTTRCVKGVSLTKSLAAPTLVGCDDVSVSTWLQQPASTSNPSLHFGAQ